MWQDQTDYTPEKNDIVEITTKSGAGLYVQDFYTLNEVDKWIVVSRMLDSMKSLRHMI